MYISHNVLKPDFKMFYDVSTTLFNDKNQKKIILKHLENCLSVFRNKRKPFFQFQFRVYCYYFAIRFDNCLRFTKHCQLSNQTTNQKIILLMIGYILHRN